ncbi:MAG TPA: hypothetical protein VGP67_08965 [Gaiellales bacterium]|nr:hypothetical protein [Gaiellales bacterium]
MQDVDARMLWTGAGAVCAALVAHDIDALCALMAEELWERAAAEELAPLAEHAVAARPLGVLGRHTILHATTPGAAYPAYVVEQQWTPAAGHPLVEDERLFTLIDRAALETAGDAGRLARLATKLAAQDAALGYVDALNAHDAAAVMALWAPDFAAGRVGVMPRVDGLRSAELIGSVGPRTLVLCRFDDHDETQELLWRPLDGRILVQGQRSFRPPRA